MLRVTGFWFGVLSPAWYKLELRWTPKGLPHVPSRLTLALLMPGFVPLGSFGRWEAQSAPTPRTSGISAARLVRTGNEVGPLGLTSRIIAPYFRATGDGFLVWGSFPRLVRVGIEVDPEGLPHVLSRLTLALLMPGFIPLGSFGRWEAQSAPTPRTSSISATRLVRSEGKVETHRESPRIIAPHPRVAVRVAVSFG